ncbi:alpha/beta fold hydrolase [Prauserella halophila]|uniref:Alpha/beta fold hydrolase n=1 Tax=Prauserella halophila TaxID=185641 RepID=A0ABP4GXB5_9PSEU|nr:lysophospholipase [Prauserella halophila]MCP2235782.1 Alpha/beta hydrolase family protein [Prauserella halophila]
MPVRDTLAIPCAAAPERVDIYSGVARLSQTLWASRWRAEPHQNDVAVLIVHPTSNFLGHYALRPLAELGVDAVGLTTRFIGNDSSLTMEDCVVDIGAAIRYLREIGYRKVLLVGNSGGGGLAALYQSHAERPTITATPAEDPPDLTAADLPSADALVMAMAHPGRATVFTEYLDPAIVDESRPFERDAELDMFDPRNGPSYSAEFITRYRAAQIARNRRITAWVRGQLEWLRDSSPVSPEGNKIDNMPFVVHGTAADPRSLDLTLDPSDRLATTLWGDPWVANYQPATLGHLTSLRAWLSQWSFDDSRANAPAELPHVTVPVQVIYGSADTAAFPSHAQAMFDAINHDRRELNVIKGADHYFRGQPELAREMCEHIVRWARESV